ncbi:MAG: LysR substrate-binding domain-containing protein [Pseudomonadota bacterium]
MPNYRQSLPQLDLLIAFEAAARHGSFTRAAEELNITQSAVSQQIRTLERRLDLTLFQRAHRIVRLSPEGRAFQNSVSVALNHLVNATNALREKGTSRLTIATDDSVAALWLAPRLHRFQQFHPEIQLRLTASDRPEDCFAEDIELSIVHGDGNWSGYECEPFIEEEVIPVCSPGYLEQTGPLETIDDLGSRGLIDLEYERWSWMNWSIWLTEKGAAIGPDQRVLQCNAYPVVLEAARQGQGIALGWRGFIEDDLAAGTLVAPLDEPLRTRNAYYLALRYNQPVSARAEAFRNWLKAERLVQIETTSLPK